MQFSLYRVWLLSKKQWAENRQLYLLGLLATAGVMGAAFFSGVTQSEGLNYGLQRTIFLGGSMIAGGLFASTILSNFNDKIKGIQALTLPASAAEKLVTALIYTLILFPAAYLLVVYPVLALVNYADVEIIGHINSLYNLSMNGHLAETVWVYMTLQAAILLCSVLFKRYTIVKTIVFIFLVIYFSAGINPLIASNILDTKNARYTNVNIRQVLYNEDGKIMKDTLTHGNVIEPELQPVLPYSDVRMNNKNEYYKIAFKLDKPHLVMLVLAISDTGKLIFAILFLLEIPFLWLITWFRLKETQL